MGLRVCCRERNIQHDAVHARDEIAAAHEENRPVWKHNSCLKLFRNNGTIDAAKKQAETLKQDDNVAVMQENVPGTSEEEEVAQECEEEDPVRATTRTQIPTAKSRPGRKYTCAICGGDSRLGDLYVVRENGALDRLIAATRYHLQHDHKVFHERRLLVDSQYMTLDHLRTDEAVHSNTVLSLQAMHAARDGPGRTR